MQINYIKSFSQSLSSWVSYHLEQAKESMQLKVIHLKKELDYRPSKEVLRFRQQQNLSRKIQSRVIPSVR